MSACASSFAEFIAKETRLVRPSLCPEICLHLSPDLTRTWEAQERELGTPGLAPPYWASAWPGGQALARHLLDNPVLVAGQRVLDLGCGSGLCAIAAALAGGARVDAADTDRYACEAASMNASANGVAVQPLCADLIGDLGARWDVVLAADLWYERFLAQRVTGWLRQLAGAGVRVLVGDLGRAFLPRQGMRELGRYPVANSEGLERAGVNAASAYLLGAPNTPARDVPDWRLSGA